MNRNYAEGEVVPGLGCDFGTFHLAAPRKPGVTVSRSRIPDCHNSVESPGDRHHCEMCGGDYCSVHAKIDAHDCQNVVIER